ncbi:50S ribosome-binding GTPase, partial [Candidatus Marithioploca araucensis]|nr:50S ribosome-binding GTPase [Candidatus Marithioploca araucensis]
MANRTVMIMVGPDGVGKTTLLATMYHELSLMNNSSGFEFTANEDTRHDLQEAYQKLSTIITQPTFTQTGSLLKGTAGIVERQFEILFKGKKELELAFCDIAGGLIRSKENSDKENSDFDDFQNKLKETLVIINVIDGSALVEGNDELLNSKNDPIQVYDLLRSKLLE